MATGWTLERGRRQAEAIRSWRSWEYSTGPRSPVGKARSARNPIAVDIGEPGVRWSDYSTLSFERYSRSIWTSALLGLDGPELEWFQSHAFGLVGARRCDKNSPTRR
jgi:hypothetical protein